MANLEPVRWWPDGGEQDVSLQRILVSHEGVTDENATTLQFWEPSRPRHDTAKPQCHKSRTPRGMSLLRVGTSLSCGFLPKKKKKKSQQMSRVLMKPLDELLMCRKFKGQRCMVNDIPGIQLTDSRSRRPLSEQ